MKGIILAGGSGTHLYCAMGQDPPNASETLVQKLKLERSLLPWV